MKKILSILFLFAFTLSNAQNGRYNGWLGSGNSWGRNTVYLGTNDTFPLILKTNSLSRFKIDGNGITRTFSTVTLPTINGMMSYNGSQGGANGFTFYSDDASNLSPIVTFSNSSNYLSLYQDHTLNNWLYVPNGYNIVLSNDGGATQAYDMEQYSHSWNIQKRTSGTGVVYQWSCPNSTSLTAGTEATNFNFIVAGTTEFQTGALSKQRFVKIGQPTVKFIGASTLTDGVTTYITGAPIAGTNATQTNATSLKIGGITGTVSVGAGTTNSYGLWCYANQGATNNYAGCFMGGSVGIGTVSPVATLHIIGNLLASTTATITGNMLASGTLSVTGATSLNGITNVGNTSSSGTSSVGLTQTVTGVSSVGGFSLSAGSFTVGSKVINTTAGDAATINSPCGRFRKDVTGTTFVLTNSFITANSIIILTLASGATHGYDMDVSAGSGTATINFNEPSLVTGIATATAPSSNQDVNFIIIN